jgi:hypothetical protein
MMEAGGEVPSRNMTEPEALLFKMRWWLTPYPRRVRLPPDPIFRPPCPCRTDLRTLMRKPEFFELARPSRSV